MGIKEIKQRMDDLSQKIDDALASSQQTIRDSYKFRMKHFKDDKPVEVPILAVGHQRSAGVLIGAEDLEELVNNFGRVKNEIKPPFKLGGKQKVGAPAFGWVDGLKVAGGKLIAVLTGLPEKIKKAIQNKKYEKIQTEIMDGYLMSGLNIGRVLSGLSLIGSGLKVEDLDDLQAFLTEDQAGTYASLVYFKMENNTMAKKTFSTKQEAEDDLYERAKKMEFDTGNDFGECYEWLLTDDSDPAVIMLSGGQQAGKSTEREKAEQELDKIAQRQMLREDCSYIEALSFAMKEKPDLAAVYMDMEQIQQRQEQANG